MHPEPNFPVRPDEFVGRSHHIEAFREALRQGLMAGRTSSFAILGDWGIGKSSLLLKFAAVCAEPAFAFLPILFSASTDIHDYMRLAESLLDKFGDALLAMPNLEARLRAELRNWRLKQLNLGAVGLERHSRRLFLSSGSSLLRHKLKEAWDHFFRPAQLNGATFFLDDLQNIGISKSDLALTIRDQFQVFGTSPDPSAIIATWLHEKTLGHPYFLAFVCKRLSTLEGQIHSQKLEAIWPAIFDQLGREKFRSDIAQLSAKELGLAHQFASFSESDIPAHHLTGKIHREHRARLVEKGVLIRTGRGRYKLYHPLFREFLRQTQ